MTRLGQAVLYDLKEHSLVFDQQETHRQSGRGQAARRITRP
jgi:hypothetical protein